MEEVEKKVLLVSQRFSLLEELQLEILSWLPGKSLARCNCVCKLWNHSFTSTAFLLRHSRSLASASYYTEDYEHRPPCPYLVKFTPHWPKDDNTNNNNNNTNTNNNNNSSIVIKGLRTPWPFDGSSSTPSQVRFFEVSNLCDDLACLYHFSGFDFDSKKSAISLYSLRSKSFLYLPTKTQELDPLLTRRSYVGKQRKCYMGFDPVQKVYKVMRALIIFQGHRYSCKWLVEYEILTVGSKSWKRADKNHVPPSIQNGAPKDGCFCLDGVIYWVHNDSVWDYNKIDTLNFVIASLDLGREEFHAVEVDQLVGCDYNVDNHYYLTPLKGRTTLFFKKKDHEDILQLTMLDREKTVWTRKIFTSHVFSSISPPPFKKAAGRSTIILTSQTNKCSWYYDLENNAKWVVDLKDDDQE